MALLSCTQLCNGVGSTFSQGHSELTTHMDIQWILYIVNIPLQLGTTPVHFPLLQVSFWSPTKSYRIGQEYDTTDPSVTVSYSANALDTLGGWLHISWEAVLNIQYTFVNTPLYTKSYATVSLCVPLYRILIAKFGIYWYKLITKYCWTTKTWNNYSIKLKAGLLSI